jgi:hypothetical protein
MCGRKRSAIATPSGLIGLGQGVLVHRGGLLLAEALIVSERFASVALGHLAG